VTRFVELAALRRRDGNGCRDSRCRLVAPCSDTRRRDRGLGDHMSMTKTQVMGGMPIECDHICVFPYRCSLPSVALYPSQLQAGWVARGHSLGEQHVTRLNRSTKYRQHVGSRAPCTICTYGDWCWIGLIPFCAIRHNQGCLSVPFNTCGRMALPTWHLPVSLKADFGVAHISIARSAVATWGA
jgi:hypothetical protein